MGGGRFDFPSMGDNGGNNIVGGGDSSQPQGWLFSPRSNSPMEYMGVSLKDRKNEY